MTRERVDEMLKTYRFEVGRCGHLQAEIKLLNMEIERDKANMAADLVGPGAQEITDMPRGTTVGNPTERYGLMLASGWMPDEIRQKEARVAELSAEFEERSKTVMYVDAWLMGLPERERWMIEKQVIDGAFWKEVGSQYMERFGENVSKDTLKRIRDKALERIYKMAS